MKTKTKLHPVTTLNSRSAEQIKPIRRFVTKGVKDATESITLKVRACDVEGANELDPQNCVIAQALKRAFKPEAVSVGRTRAYVVRNGVAYRYTVAGQNLHIDEFDKDSFFPLKAVTLLAPCPSHRLGAVHSKSLTGKKSSQKYVSRRLDVRSVTGGLVGE